jgi:LmbE family N-acetylglucosaminyl deacetylase
LLLAFPLSGQLQPPSSGGYVGLDQELRMLGHQQRVLMIAAHPDDEDTELLTLLGRGFGAEVAYLSLNRGEGGQNLIGGELGEGLGLLRTGELLAARNLDGASQYFTRAYDFGFSKTLDDTWAHWPRDSILKDVVRTIRRFRPQVVISIFSGTPRDGHGQHQAAGWAAREAFRVAGDAAVFPELLTEEGLAAFAPAKLYRNARFDTAGTTLTMEGGALDPAVGQSYHQIAMRGRSLHRSQDMGQLQGMGPSAVRLQLLEDRTGLGREGLFAGVDTTLPAPYVALVDSLRQTPLQDRSARMVPLLARAQAVLERLAGESGAEQDPSASLTLGAQRDHLSRALLAASGMVLDAVLSDDRVVPGQPVTMALAAWNTGPESVTVSGVPVTSGAIDFGTVSDTSCAVAPGQVLRWSLAGTVAGSPGSGTPYFLRSPRVGDLYTWPATDPDTRQSLMSSWGLPFAPPLRVRFEVRGGAPGWRASAEPELSWRSNDQARGEIRNPIEVVPRIEVSLEPATEVWPAGRGDSAGLVVTLTHRTRGATTGTVTIEVPSGWSAVKPQRFQFDREDETLELPFAVRPPLGYRGTAALQAEVLDDAGGVYHVGLTEVDYPHVHPRSYAVRAAARIVVAPVAVPLAGRVAYLRGAADKIPEALAGTGVRLELITGTDLGRRSFRGYRAIVIGPRAYETDPDLPRFTDRLLDYARAGGTVIVQYQQYGYFLDGRSPYNLTVGVRSPGSLTAVGSVARSDTTRAPALLGGHDRVTDETAPVRVISPSSPVLLRPNRIGPADWDGWVQERGLYFAHSWGPEWTPVLEMHDPGEAPLEGGLLLARLGRGRYVYTGLSFFRQLPAAVPGAVRLFLNLLALGESGAARPAAAAGVTPTP